MNSIRKQLDTDLENKAPLPGDINSKHSTKSPNDRENHRLLRKANRESIDLKSSIDNSNFFSQQEGFGRGHDTASDSSQNHPNNDAALNRPLTPTMDVQYIISEIKFPKDVNTAVQEYKPRSKYINMEDLCKYENTKIKKYKNGLYFGQIVNGKRHGKVYVNGRIYEGEWENEVKHGKGLEICPNGSQYDGYYVNGKPEGKGTFTWNNGEIYEGEWSNGLKHGSGVWHGAKGESYTGEWKYGKAEGHGVYVASNGDRCEGEFKNCLKHGHGTEQFANGDMYNGNFMNGKPDGYGEYFWANGCQYKGFFKNGLKHGKGTWKKGAGNADKYEGDWVNDKKWGHGIYTWATGNVYKGSYCEDLRHGYGEMTWADGSVYKGQWERGAQNGEGEFSAPGKSLKKGLFKNNIFISELNEREDVSQANRKPNKLSPIQRPTNEISIQTDFTLEHPPIKLNPIISINKTPAENKLATETPEKQKKATSPDILSKSIEKKSLSPPPGGWLTIKEIAKWNIVSERLGIDLRKYEDLKNKKVIKKIRKIIHPKIWRYWQKGEKVKGKSDVENQKTMSAALQYYNGVN